jgi:hypothetical protein
VNDKPSVLMAGGVPITVPSVENMQLNMLLWGDSGSGKTTLASTAPGTKLFILLDPGGDLSLVDRDDVLVLDLSSQSPTQMMSQFRSSDPYRLGAILKERPDIETVVIDSMTALAYAALREAVQRAGGSKISIEQPGMQGYGYRNASLLRVTVAVMQVCAEHKRHLILITHEGNADRNDAGVIQSVTMALSDSVANQVGLRFNEVWHLSDIGTERRIAVRPCRLRKPMKTRLFQSDKMEFVWHFNPDTHVGEGIADWYHAWQEGNGRKLALPARAVQTISRGVEKKGPH